MTAPSTVAGEFCALLDELGVGQYRPASVGGNVFLLNLPPDPDLAMRVAPYAGPEADQALAYDEPQLQVWVRGPRGDPETALATAQVVYDATHGLRPRTLPGGTPMESCIGTQSGPIYVGPDEHGRHELTVNVRLEVRRRTSNRNRT